MTKTFLYSKKFSEKWNSLELSDDDLILLEKHLLENPQAGVVVRGTGGLRKLRWMLPKKGKSGGIRVAYIDVVIREKIYMLDLFPKNEKDNYTEAEKRALKQAITEIKKGGE